ncbi:MAG: hypothetical protein K0U72_09750 [Gammaproteobacteria bacterium]|nr:hypothetical protein [Gammaproteobacteria bacterium]
MSEELFQRLEILDWGEFLHPDTRRKCKAPLRWCKLQTEFLDTLGDLSCADMGAYIRLVMLAATTDNKTVYKPEWIRRRAGVSRQAIDKLSARGLVRVVTKTVNSEKAQQNQTASQEIARTNLEVDQHAARPDRNRSELNGKEGMASAGIRPNGRQPDINELLAACIDAGVSGGDWTGQRTVIETKYGFMPSEKQHHLLERQLNDRAGK